MHAVICANETEIRMSLPLCFHHWQNAKSPRCCLGHNLRCCDGSDTSSWGLGAFLSPSSVKLTTVTKAPPIISMGPTAKFHLAEIMTTLFVSSIISAYLQAQRQMLALGFPTLSFFHPILLALCKRYIQEESSMPCTTTLLFVQVIRKLISLRYIHLEAMCESVFNEIRFLMN